MKSSRSRFEVDVSLDPDPVIEAYKKDVDRTLIRENLKLTPEQRLIQLMKFQEFVEEASKQRVGGLASVTDFPVLLRALQQAGVDFIVIGGAAATAHGSARLTLDLDIVYDRSPENLQRLVKGLGSIHPYLRGAPPGLPFRFDAETLRRGLNFTLTTDVGPIDLLGEVAGGDYEALLPSTEPLAVFDIECRCLSLERLIQVKRAAGRPKDLEAIAELEAIVEERKR